MRFDPQSNFMPEEESAAPPPPPDETSRPKASLRVSVLIVVVAVAAALGLWIWSQSQPLTALADDGRATGEVVGATPEQSEVGPATEPDAETPSEAVDAEAAAVEPAPPQKDPMDLSREAHTRGERFFAMGRYEKSIPYLKAAINLDPNNAKARYKLAIASVRTGDMEQAKRQRDQLRQLDENLANLLGNLVP
jgi:Flp pilus assembly protein TadD